MPSIAKLLAKDVFENDAALKDVMRAAAIIFPADDTTMWIVFKDRSVMTVSAHEIVSGEIANDDWEDFLVTALTQVGKFAMREWIERKFPHLAS